MLRKITLMVLLCLFILTMGGCKAQESSEAQSEDFESESDLRIGIVTGGVSQSQDELRGAEALIKEYGDADQGGIVKHVTYPDNFMQEQETTIAQIVGLAEDPQIKVIVVNQAVPGTVAAFKAIREMRSDMILLACQPQEDAGEMEKVANLVVDADNVKRGYLMIDAAKKMGAKTFVHLSFERHMGIEVFAKRKKIMEAACQDLGIKFISLTVPDPMSDVGIPKAKAYITENMPNWVNLYGKDTAFFCTNDAQTEPLLKSVASLGAIFVEADIPSPLMGYPAAFDIDLKAESGNWPAVLKKVEKAVVSYGGKGRMGTWAYSYTYTSTMALAEFGKRVVEGQAKIDSLEDLMACYEKYTPGAEWNGSYDIDPITKQSRKGRVLLYQDTYVFGGKYLGQTKVEVPAKYLTLQ